MKIFKVNNWGFKILSFSIVFLSCVYVKSSFFNMPNINNITFEYVNIYTTTPVMISKEKFEKYFDSSIHKRDISNIDSIAGINNFFKQYFDRTKSFPTDTDVRIIITFSNGREKYKILIGSSTVSFNNKNYIIDEQLIKDLNTTLNTNW
jgi:hypothetical protein